MKTITKTTLCIFMLAVLMVTFATNCMEKKEIPRCINFIQNPFIHSNYEISLTGIIELKENTPAGYGSKECLDALEEAGMHTEQQWPLIAVDILIEDPKEDPNAKQTYTNWTEQTPRIITHKRNKFIEKKIKKEEEKLISLYGKKITPSNRGAWNAFNLLSEQIKASGQKAEPIIIPALIPVNILFSPSIQNKFFKSYQTTLVFKQHEQLEKRMGEFHIRPQATFTMLDLPTTKMIKQAQAMSHNNSPAERADCYRKIRMELYIQTNATNQTLEEKNIIINELPGVLSRDYDFITPEIGIIKLNNHTHGHDGCSKDTFRNFLLKNELNDQTPRALLNNRAITGKK